MDTGELFKLSDGREVRILPLTLNAKRRLDKVDAWVRVASTNQEDQIDAMLAICHEVLKRAHPELGIEDVGDMIDSAMVKDFLDAVSRVNGGRRSQPGEAPSP